MADFVGLVKQAAVEAVDASKPVAWGFGVVISVNPLEVKTDQKITLSKDQLILTRNVTNHDVSMQLGSSTDSAGSHDHSVSTTNGSGTAAEAGDHAHNYGGTLTFKVLNGLKAGEKVLLCRKQGGQKYIVIDRLEE